MNLLIEQKEPAIDTISKKKKQKSNTSNINNLNNHNTNNNNNIPYHKDDKKDDEITPCITDKYLLDLNQDVQYIIIQYLSPMLLLYFSTTDKYRFKQVRSTSSSSSSSSKPTTTTMYPNLWEKICHELWKDKVYIPRFILKQPRSLKTYFYSIKDSKRQFFLTEHELCEQHFHFRFRLQSGYYWYSKDPSFKEDDTPMYRSFNKDKTFNHAPPSSLNTIEHQQFTLNKDYIKIPKFDFLIDDPEVVAHLPSSIKWKMTKSKNGKKGQFIKVNQWPSLHVTRNTDTDWGWTLEEEWVKYQTCSPSTLSKSRIFMYDTAPEFDSEDSEPEPYILDDIETGEYRILFEEMDDVWDNVIEEEEEEEEEEL